MKLISRFILIYLVVTVVVLGIGGYLSFFIIQDELNTELKWRFMGRIHRVTQLLEEGKDFNPGSLREPGEGHLIVQPLPNKVEDSTAIEDTLVWHHRLQQMEPNLKVSAYRTVQDTSYFISTYGALVETEDITEAVSEILLWILGMQVIGAIGMGFIISNRLFKPFHKTLGQIKAFDLQKKQHIKAEPASVKEFADLNHFVEEMTQKAINDYKNLKEFAENTSHELKTPLAIAQGKLELLAETSLNEEQHRYVEASQRSISKLNKLGTSLGLLTKIKNEEFSQKELINFSELVNHSLQGFQELIDLHQLQVEAHIEEGVKVALHSTLADILWTNLFQNAIKHNIEKGTIEIWLTSEKLTIANTGPSPSVEPEVLFKRFKKGDPRSESIGLGLAIVKNIVDYNGFHISYTFREPIHQIEVFFSYP